MSFALKNEYNGMSIGIGNVCHECNGLGFIATVTTQKNVEKNRLDWIATITCPHCGKELDKRTL